MTEVVAIVVQPSSASSMQRDHGPTRNDGFYQDIAINNPVASLHTTTQQQEEEEVQGGERKRIRRQQQADQLQQVITTDCDHNHNQQLNNNNLVGLFLTAFRRSVLGCSSCEIINKQGSGLFSSANNHNHNNPWGGVMEIGVPTNVRHVAHVTFDRFNGFLGLPVEFEPEVPRRAPSASTTVFGVSTNSMQLSFDTRGNSVPTILLMMQHRLYALGGLQAEGIFRINPDNGREENVRDQLNRGLIPDDVDVHCLAGLIKAWFRELPTGVLDCLSPEQVMQAQTEEECTELARLLPPTETALLDWAINLMADVAQYEYLNKMNARNIAMVFAPNMTHMADPLTALMHAVQVMNFLKTLIEKTLKLREDSVIDSDLDSYGRDPSGENGHHCSLQTILEEASEPDGDGERVFGAGDPSSLDPARLSEIDPMIADHVPAEDDQSSVSNSKGDEATQEDESPASKAKESTSSADKSKAIKPPIPRSCRTAQTSTLARKGPQKDNQRPVVQVAKSAEKIKGTSLVSNVNLRTPERIEAWR